VQAAAAGLSIAAGGLLSDTVAALARSGQLGATLAAPATGYEAVYLTELMLLFATLVAIGPLTHRDTAYQAEPQSAVADLVGSST
jgi:BCD family chlorophyll transporter-like MFS transporter